MGSRRRPAADEDIRPLTVRRLAEAVAHLRASDPHMARAIDEAGPCSWRVREDGTHFDHLARAIVYQQLSVTAAATIYGRFVAQCGEGTPPSAERVLALDDAQLRACGLSGAKTAAIRDLARHVLEERLPLDRLHAMDDQAVIDALVTVRGIGPWTAQMFLMFRLWRADVLPVLDIGVRKGAQRIYGLRTVPDEAKLTRLARNWRPFASVGSWYCWRILEGDSAEGW